MSAYVPPHLRNKKPAAAASSGPAAAPAQRNLGSWSSPERRAPPGGNNSRFNNDDNAGDMSRMKLGSEPRRSTEDARFGGGQDARFGGGERRSTEDARFAAPQRYVSAYEDACNARKATQQGDEGAAPAAVDGESTTDQYAKMVEFSRYRRENLGMRRPESSSAPRKKQSAPRAFGTNDHGRGMEVADDLPGGKRVDDEGMVYEMDDGSCIFFCDRFRRYRFFCKSGGLSLLRGLVSVNHRNIAACNALFDKEPSEAARQRAEGYALYEEKPNLRKQREPGNEIGTWSDAEYGLPGFQWMYLRLKSFQRFTETWALLERVRAAGLFEGSDTSDDKLRVVSLGGGPGYELLAYDFFDRCFAHDMGTAAADGQIAEHVEEWTSAIAKPNSKATYVSLDQQPSWDTYVEHLGYDFGQWDVHNPKAAEAVLGDSNRVVCMLSNIMCYCTDDQTADLFAMLLNSGRCRAIIANERGAEQGIIPKLERRGICILRLLDQAVVGIDDRQFMALPPKTKLPNPKNIPLRDDFVRIFPNCPYEEKKGVKSR